MRQMISISEELAKEIKEKAADKGLSMSAYIRMIILEKWKEDNKGE